MAGFTKLFSSIISSSIWQESKELKIVWVTMLAMADQNGKVEAAIPGLAHLAGVTTAECFLSVEKLLAPDPYSRTPDNEGRRIKKVDGGWVILNHGKYRQQIAAEDRAAYKREWDRKHRKSRPNSKSRKSAQNTNPTTPDQPPTPPDRPTTPDTTPSENPRQNPTIPTQAEAEADVNTDKCAQGAPSGEKSGKKEPPEDGAPKPQKHPVPPPIELVRELFRQYAPKLPEVESEKFFDHYQSNGWRVGRVPMKSVDGAVRNWKRRFEERNYDNSNCKSNGNSHIPSTSLTKGTINEQVAGQYAGVGRVVPVSDVQRPTT